MKRTTTLLAVAAMVGAAAIATPLFLGPDAEADEPMQPTRAALQGERGTIEIGTVEDVMTTLSYLTEAEQVLHYPDAEYVKVHFSRLDLMPGDYVTVSDPEGDEEYRYESGQTDWATSISGDTAVVKLHGESGLLSGVMSRYGIEVDKVARGYSAEELADLQQQRQRTESVCGRDDQVDAVCYESSEPQIHDSSASVARLLIDGTTLCTAFRVSEDNRLLTNNHCFDSTASAKSTEVWFNYACMTCDGGDVGAVTKVRGAEVLDTDATYDYTLFSVDDFESIEEFGHLTLADRKARPREKLYIPQHPGGAPTQIALDSDADRGACRVDDPTFDGYASNSDVSYFCDTMFGSSGSPVISRDTHEVIALHHFGGCPNSGVRSDIIVERIGSML
ncbi:MAG TPA: serine protease [Candidatus Stackebrandtia excrementipullorum]|nr:serine protease [Candidatus Stackebrandtia excrementipullorum]